MEFSDSANIEFFVSNSISQKKADFIYKLGLFRCNLRLKGSTTSFIQVRFIINFQDSKSYFLQSKLMVTLVSQFFRGEGKFHQKKFGLKNEHQIFNFFTSFRSKILNYFLIYNPKYISDKFIPMGVIGKTYPYFRFLILDIFNFLGPEVFKDFYLDYFSLNGFFSFDFNFQITEVVSNFKFENFPSKSFFWIYSFSTFFKIF